MVAQAQPKPSATSPSLTGPIAGPPMLALSSFPLSEVGYQASEYFFAGQATAYTSSTPLESDGVWSAAPSSKADYQSRMVVAAPTDPAKFSGTVLVEWLNVSAGIDSAADWSLGHDEMIRNGDVYIGVSAQAVGVNALSAADAGRYGSLEHPGDSYSYDIFTQVGMAVRTSAATILPGGLQPAFVIAMGESQSAFRLTTYVNAVAPLTHVFDAFLVHSRGGSSAALAEAPLPEVPAPAAVYIRTDKPVPVLTFQTETDGTLLGYLAAVQEDSAAFRLWEVAGTAHADGYVLSVSQGDNGSADADRDLFSLMSNPPRRSTWGASPQSAPRRSTPASSTTSSRLHCVRSTPGRAPAKRHGQCLGWRSARPELTRSISTATCSAAFARRRSTLRSQLSLVCRPLTLRVSACSSARRRPSRPNSSPSSIRAVTTSCSCGRHRSSGRRLTVRCSQQTRGSSPKSSELGVERWLSASER